MAAALVFGAADALQLRLQSYESIPREVWLVMAMVAAAALVVARLRRGNRDSSVFGTIVGGAIVAVGVALFVIGPEWHFPPQLWLTMPYVLALLVLG